MSKIAAAGDEINAAALKELLLKKMVPRLQQIYPALRNVDHLVTTPIYAARPPEKFLKKNMISNGCWSLYRRFRRRHLMWTSQNKAF
jgi:hypothetical protein